MPCRVHVENGHSTVGIAEEMREFHAQKREPHAFCLNTDFTLSLDYETVMLVQLRSFLGTNIRRLIVLSDKIRACSRRLLEALCAHHLGAWTPTSACWREAGTCGRGRPRSEAVSNRRLVQAVHVAQTFLSAVSQAFQPADRSNTR